MKKYLYLCSRYGKGKNYVCLRELWTRVGKMDR